MSIPADYPLIAVLLRGMLWHNKPACMESDRMGLDELNGKYRRLRNELDEAYAAPEWDSDRIDLITEALAPLEMALASFQKHNASAPTCGGSNV